jgi:predicted SprT family Zn-dependent metalloprotease
MNDPALSLSLSPSQEEEREKKQTMMLASLRARVLRIGGSRQWHQVLVDDVYRPRSLSSIAHLQPVSPSALLSPASRQGEVSRNESRCESPLLQPGEVKLTPSLGLFSSSPVLPASVSPPFSIPSFATLDQLSEDLSVHEDDDSVIEEDAFVIGKKKKTRNKRVLVSSSDEEDDSRSGDDSFIEGDDSFINDESEEDISASSDSFSSSLSSSLSSASSSCCSNASNLDEGHEHDGSFIVISSDDDDYDPAHEVKHQKQALRRTESVAQFTRRREVYSQSLFDKLNRGAFDGKLPEAMQITWNKRLNRTAGMTRLKRVNGQRVATIELSTKVLTNHERLEATLAHELCHAAAWLVHGVSKPPHGKHFKFWGQQVERNFPELEITTCHSYEIQFKFRWVCKTCTQTYGRHSKSIDITKQRCGVCRSTLTFVGRFDAEGNVCKPRKSRKDNKENDKAAETDVIVM